MLVSAALWPLVRASARDVLGSALLMLLGTCAGVGSAVATGVALDRALQGNSASSALVWAAALLVVRVALGLVHDRVSARLAVSVTRDLRARLVDRILAVGPEVLAGTRVGALGSTVVDGAAATAGYVAIYAPTLVATVLGTVVVGLVLAWLAPVPAALLVVGVLAVPLLQQAWKRATAARGAAYWTATGDYAARVQDTLHGLTTLAALGTADRQVAVLRRDADEIARTATAGLRSAMFVYVLTTGSLGVATAGATIALAAHSGAGGLGSGAALVAWLLLPEGTKPWQTLQNAWHAGFSGISASAAVTALLDQPLPVSDRAGASTGAVGPAPTVRLEGVAVVRGDRRILDDVNLEIAGGSTVALVGRSGAGKSTLLSVLMRHLDPSSGRVLVDGTDLRDFPLAAVRGAVAWVSQDVVLLHGTVADNLRLAAPAASYGDLLDAARRARLLLPPAEGGLSRGLETEVGERGDSLSGGQRQRVAVARALLRDSPLLVLDEATSALDAANERAVTEALAAASVGRTVIVVAHHRSALPPVDAVVLVAGGTVSVAEDRVEAVLA